MYFCKYVVFVFFLYCLLLPGINLAQHKKHLPGAVWPELQVEYVLKSTSYFYFRNHYRHNLDQDVNYLTESGPLQYLERAQVRAGFEHVFNGKWSIGIAESYAVERTRKILFNEVYFRHSGTYSGFRLTKRASFEHIARRPQEDIGRIRLRLDLDREYKLSNRAFRPRIFYELFLNLDYTPEAEAKQNLRKVDRTRLRFEIAYPVNPHFMITPYFMRQTDFVKVKPTLDEGGNVVRNGGKQNIITPIFGLDLRYNLFQGGKPFSRSVSSDQSK